MGRLGWIADLPRRWDLAGMPLSVRQTTAPTRENIYWPSGTPRGGIVCLYGSEGGWAGWNDLTCALFAANGFVALSRNYTKDAQWLRHPDIDDVPLDGTEAALATLWLELAPFACGVGLFGASRGAEHALLLAQLLAEDERPSPQVRTPWLHLLGPPRRRPACHAQLAICPRLLRCPVPVVGDGAQVG